MSSPHDEQSLAAPYVLGALDTAERRAFEAHIATCRVCADEVRSLRPVAEALAHAVPPRTPNPAVRARVLAAATGRADEAARSRPSVGGALTWLPAAAAFAIAVGLGGYAWRLQDRVSTLETRLDDAERRAATAQQQLVKARDAADQAQSAMAILAAPDVARIDLKGQTAAPQATARALWSRNRGMVFTATNLPPLPAGRVFQVWVLTGQAPVSAGLITPDSSGRATAVFQTPPDIAPPEGVAVTVEPAPGVPAPTTDPFLVGKPL